MKNKTTRYPHGITISMSDRKVKIEDNFNSFYCVFEKDMVDNFISSLFYLYATTNALDDHYTCYFGLDYSPNSKQWRDRQIIKQFDKDDNIRGNYCEITYRGKYYIEYLKNYSP